MKGRRRTGPVETLPPPQPHNLDWSVDLEEEEDNADRITGSVGTSPSPPQRVGRVVESEDEADMEHDAEKLGRGVSVQTA